jgi:hypothetical protein
MKRTVVMVSAAVVMAVVALGSSPQAKSVQRDDPCDDSGDGQYALCSGIALANNQRLISPEGYYRIYFESGYSYVLNTTSSDPDDWYIVAYIDNLGYSDASHLVFDAPVSEDEYGTLNLTGFQLCDGGECPYRVYTTGDADGEAYLAVDDDGCGRIYDEDGGEVRYEYCSTTPAPVATLARFLKFDSVGPAQKGPLGAVVARIAAAERSRRSGLR